MFAVSRPSASMSCCSALMSCCSPPRAAAAFGQTTPPAESKKKLHHRTACFTPPFHVRVRIRAAVLQFLQREETGKDGSLLAQLCRWRLAPFPAGEGQLASPSATLAAWPAAPRPRIWGLGDRCSALPFLSDRDRVCRVIGFWTLTTDVVTCSEASAF